MVIYRLNAFSKIDNDHNYSALNEALISMTFKRGCSLHEQAFR